MARHAKGRSWVLRREGLHPDLPNGYVRTLNREQVQVVVRGPGEDAQVVHMDRRTAALMAKRIIECLEATR